MDIRPEKGVGHKTKFQTTRGDRLACTWTLFLFDCFKKSLARSQLKKERYVHSERMIREDSGTSLRSYYYDLFLDEYPLKADNAGGTTQIPPSKIRRYDRHHRASKTSLSSSLFPRMSSFIEHKESFEYETLAINAFAELHAGINFLTLAWQNCMQDQAYVLLQERPVISYHDIPYADRPLGAPKLFASSVCSPLFMVTVVWNVE